LSLVFIILVSWCISVYKLVSLVATNHRPIRFLFMHFFPHLTPHSAPGLKRPLFQSGLEWRPSIGFLLMTVLCCPLSDLPMPFLWSGTDSTGLVPTPPSPRFLLHFHGFSFSKTTVCLLLRLFECFCVVPSSHPPPRFTPSGPQHWP